MLKLIATVIIPLTLAQSSCCPKQDCPASETRLCCEQCPPTCLVKPSQMVPLQFKALNCKSLSLNWRPPKSCAPILFAEAQCIGSDGGFKSLPYIPGALLEWTVETGLFFNAPFSLKLNDALVCKVRSRSKQGWSAWSNISKPFILSSCPVEKKIEKSFVPK